MGFRKSFGRHPADTPSSGALFVGIIDKDSAHGNFGIAIRLNLTVEPGNQFNLAGKYREV